jgi:hypothetical protein
VVQINRFSATERVRRAGLRLLSAIVGALVFSTPLPAQPVRNGSQFQVNSYTTFNQTGASVAMDATGQFVVVWSGAGTSDGTGIFSRRFGSDGLPLGAADFRLNNATSSVQFAPAVASDPSGDFIVSWSSYAQDGDSFGIFFRRFDSSGSATDPVDLMANSFTAGTQMEPAVDVLGSGGFVIAWSGENQADGYGIAARGFDASAMPILPGDVQVNTYLTSVQAGASIAADSDGNFVVAWDGVGANDGFGIFSRRFDSKGAALDVSDLRVNTVAGYFQLYPVVASGPDGRFVVVWESLDQDGDGSGIFFRRFDSNGNPADSTGMIANTYTASDQFSPAVAMDTLGRFTVVWHGTGPGDADGVFVRRFNADGSPGDLAETLVNDYTTGTQTTPSVSMNDDGVFAVAWEGEGAGDSDGIFAQQFSCDTDGDGLCDDQDILVTSHFDGSILNCSSPGISRPIIRWSRGNYDRFRAVITWDPNFPLDQSRISSGQRLIRRSMWAPSSKQWKRACNKASPDLYIRIFGVNRGVHRKHPRRRTLSNVVSAVRN